MREQKFDAEAKRARRVEASRSLVTVLFAWRSQEIVASVLLPTSPFTGAVCHALKLNASLEVFRSDPAVPIDTNHLERALQPIPMGRKAWLFCWTESGRRRWGSSRA